MENFRKKNTADFAGRFRRQNAAILHYADQYGCSESYDFDADADMELSAFKLLIMLVNNHSRKKISSDRLLIAGNVSYHTSNSTL